MNRVLSFGVLLFSFALIMLGSQPKGNLVSFVFTVPVPSLVEYRVIGLFVITVSLFLMITTIRTKWSDWAENMLRTPSVYFIWFVIFEGVYILGYLKGLSAVIEVSPSWVVHIAFFVGYALVLYIPMIAFKDLLSKSRR